MGKKIKKVCVRLVCVICMLKTFSCSMKGKSQGKSKGSKDKKEKKGKKDRKERNAKTLNFSLTTHPEGDQEGILQPNTDGLTPRDINE